MLNPSHPITFVIGCLSIPALIGLMAITWDTWKHRYLRNILVAIVVLSYIAGGIGATPDRADAHNYSNTELWVCAYTNPGGYSIDHSWPYYLVPDNEGVACMAHTGTLHACWHANYKVSTGTITLLGHYYDPCPFSPHET